MANVGQLTVNMALQSAQFLRGLQQIQNQTAATSRAIQGAMGFAKGAVAGLAAAISVDAIVGATTAAFDYADSIVDLSDRTGVATETIQKFRYAAQMSGSDVETADGALEKFAKNLGSVANGNDAMAKTFATVGVRSRDMDTAIQQAIAGISKLPTAAQRNAAAFQLFGKSASTLTVLLGSGSDNFREMSDRAEQLGLVMGDDLLRNAGQVNDQLDTLKMIVTAQMANAIVQNADGIASMAESLASLVGSLAKFWSQDPRGALAIMGALGGAQAGAMLGGGPGALLGAGLGAAGGYFAGGKMQANADARNRARYSKNDKWSRADAAERQMTAELDRLGSGGGLVSFSNARDQKAIARIKARREQMRGIKAQQEADINSGRISIGGGSTRSTVPGGDLPTGGGGSKKAPHKKTGKTAEQLAEEAAKILQAYNEDLADTVRDRLRAELDFTVEINDRGAIERDLLKREMQDRLDRINANKDYTAEQKKILTEKLIGQRKSLDSSEGEITTVDDGSVYSAELRKIAREEESAYAAEQRDIQNAALNNERDLLAGSSSMARTQHERRELGLRLVAIQYEQERIELEGIRDSKTATKAQKDIAEARLRILGQLQSNAETEVTQNTMGPLEDYLSKIPATAAEAQEALEAIQVGGLQALEDGLMGVVDGTKSVADAFGDMANYIIKSLIKIALQQAIIKPLAGMLLGGGEGGGKGLLGGIIKGVASGITGKRANGGLTREGRYLVGERGPEIVDVGKTANVIPAHRLSGAAGGGRSGPTITFGTIISNDPDAIRRAASEAVAQAIPALLPASSSYTRAQFGRPKM